MRWEDYNLIKHYNTRIREICLFSFGAVSRVLMTKDDYKRYSFSIRMHAIRKFTGKYLNRDISTATEKHYRKKCDYFIDSKMILLVLDRELIITCFHIHLVKDDCHVCDGSVSLSAMLIEHEELLKQKIISKQYIDVNQFVGFEFLGRRPIF